MFLCKAVNLFVKSWHISLMDFSIRKPPPCYSNHKCLLLYFKFEFSAIIPSHLFFRPKF